MMRLPIVRAVSPRRCKFKKSRIMEEIMIENKKLLRTCVLVVAGLFAGFLGKTAQAGTVYVGTCVSHVISYPSISAAISGAPAGTTIKICPGVYYEQLLI